jgi:hypothetical protein
MVITMGQMYIYIYIRDTVEWMNVDDNLDKLVKIVMG